MDSQLKLAFTAAMLGTIILISCAGNKGVDTREVSPMERWRLGWRLVSSSWENNYRLAEQQFDSLLNMDGSVDPRFLVTGLEVLSELGKQEKIIGVLEKQDERTLEEICSKELFTQKLTNIEVCKWRFKEEHVTNKALQLELIKMYVKDQSARGNSLKELIRKYNLDESELAALDASSIDEINRDRLKEIIFEFGFPTRQLVGKDAMQGVFLIIQHSDADKEWQKEQLANIENAVKQGDVDGQSYAYLYDRIKVNEGQKQLYGTQFRSADVKTGEVELAETEDLGNLDKRRMAVGMMPIEMYKRFILSSIPR
jgi:hypothetical protein